MTGSRLRCGLRCIQTPACRGFSIDGPLCRLLRMREPQGSQIGCGSRANIPGTTYIASLNDDIRDVSQLTKLHIVRPTAYIFIIIIIRQPLCPVVGRRPQHAVSILPCIVLSSAISCHSSICLGRLSTAWLVSLVVFSCHMVSKW